MKQHGVHTIPFPDSIKVLDKETNLKITLSAPSIKALIFTYKSKLEHVQYLAIAMYYS